jgi:hypothetical protein
MITNEPDGRKLNNTKRINRPVGWIAGGVFVVAVLGILFFYDGRDVSRSSGANPTNVVSGQPSTQK